MRAERKAPIEVMAGFAILVSLGFPGNYSRLLGAALGKALEYAAFALELLAMLMSGGDSWRDWLVVDLKKKYIPIYLYIAVIFTVSMLSSRYPAEQAVTCARLAVTALFAIWLQDFFPLDRMVSLFCAAQLAFVGLTLLFTLLRPQAAFQYGGAFCGLFTTKNACASQLSIGIVMTVFLIRQDLRRGTAVGVWFFSLAVQAALLALCQALGPLLSLAAALVLLALPENRRLNLGWACMLTNLAFLCALLLPENLIGRLLALLGKDASLTGRVPLWRSAAAFMLDSRPLTGFGYGMFWRDEQAVARFQRRFSVHSYLRTATAGAHNMLLELWLNTGIIGIAALLLTLLTASRKPGEIPSGNYRLSLLLAGFLTLNGLTERCLGSTYDSKVLSLFLLLALCCNRPAGGKRKHKREVAIEELKAGCTLEYYAP